jgi:quercetin dioxygenase-like cupin family protein
MTSTNKTANQWKPIAGGFTAACALFLARDLVAADAPPTPVAVKQAFQEKLPHVPGMTLTGIHVTYQPGAKSSSHAHAGSVYAYVLSGKIRSENSVTGPVRVYSAGEGFFEPPGSVHTISENASDTEPASLLAIFVAEDGAQLSRSAPQK